MVVGASMHGKQRSIKELEITVFRFNYSRRIIGPMIRYYDSETGKDKFLEFQSGTLPAGFSWHPEGAEQIFTKDDFLLQCASNTIIAEGYDIVSVLGPMPMWTDPGSDSFVSYQIVARKREE